MGVLFLCLMIVGIQVLLGIVGTIVCGLLGIRIAPDDYVMLFGFCTVLGFSGSLISLFMSKAMCMKAYHVRLISHPANAREQFIVRTVEGFAGQYGLKMPEVGIYESSDPNAFATGASKDAALVAVSSGLLRVMDDEAVRGVIGHEMSHVKNGDMVRMALLQGVLNTFVYFLSYIIAMAVQNAISRGRNSDSDTIGYGMQMLVRMLLQSVLGGLAFLIMMWFSRWREYRADAGSASLCGARTMIHALEALRNGACPDARPRGDTFRAMAINGVTPGELFASHPPIEKRIAALRKLA